MKNITQETTHTPEPLVISRSGANSWEIWLDTRKWTLTHPSENGEDWHKRFIQEEWRTSEYLEDTEARLDSLKNAVNGLGFSFTLKTW